MSKSKKREMEKVWMERALKAEGEKLELVSTMRALLRWSGPIEVEEEKVRNQAWALIAKAEGK